MKKRPIMKDTHIRVFERSAVYGNFFDRIREQDQERISYLRPRREE